MYRTEWRTDTRPVLIASCQTGTTSPMILAGRADSTTSITNPHQKGSNRQSGMAISNPLFGSRCGLASKPYFVETSERGNYSTQRSHSASPGRTPPGSSARCPQNGGTGGDARPSRRSPPVRERPVRFHQTAGAAFCRRDIVGSVENERGLVRAGPLQLVDERPTCAT